MKIIVDAPAAQQQTATITYSAPRPVNIGDVFYRVECGELQHFREPCRVCGDKRELTVKGVTFRCPCCVPISAICVICKLCAATPLSWLGACVPLLIALAAFPPFILSKILLDIGGK